MSSENIIKKGIGGRIGQAALAGILAFTLMPFSGAGEASASTYDDGNITVSMPTTINYVARADGTLIAPSASALAFTNLSDWEVRVSSVKVTPADGWGIADNPAAAAAADPNGNNYVSLTMGPEDDQLNLADYINTPSPVTNNIAWTMAMPAKNEDLSTVNILTTGTVANVDALTAQSETIATTEWYLAADTTTDEVFTRIADLEAENATLTTNLATLQSSYDTLSANYTALESEVDTLGDSVSSTGFIYASSNDDFCKQLAIRLISDYNPRQTFITFTGRSDHWLGFAVGTVSDSGAAVDYLIVPSGMNAWLVHYVLASDSLTITKLAKTS